MKRSIHLFTVLTLHGDFTDELLWHSFTEIEWNGEGFTSRDSVNRKHKLRVTQLKWNTN